MTVNDAQSGLTRYFTMYVPRGGVDIIRDRNRTMLVNTGTLNTGINTNSRDTYTLRIVTVHFVIRAIFSGFSLIRCFCGVRNNRTCHNWFRIMGGLILLPERPASIAY